MVEDLENLDVLNLKSKINIDCEICDKCCINRGDLKITPINVLEISKFLKIEPKEFVEKYTNPADSNKPELLIKAIGEKNRCIFNDETTAKCKIQKVKPMQCVVFPLVPFNLDFDLFVNSNQCPMKSNKKMTVDKWLNGNNKIYKRHKDIYLKWINFLEVIKPYWISFSIEKKEEIMEILYTKYDLKKNFFKQVEEHMKDIISSF